MTVGLWVALAVVVVAFLIGRAWGRREGVIRNWNDEIKGDTQDIALIFKYHTESLPLVAKELMAEYAENKKYHEDDGVEMMRAVAFHFSRITDNHIALAMKSEAKGREIGKQLDAWFEPLMKNAENAEAAFVQQIRSTVDPKFRDHLLPVNRKSFDHLYKGYGYLERYWEHTPKYREENPYAP